MLCSFQDEPINIVDLCVGKLQSSLLNCGTSSRHDVVLNDVELFPSSGALALGPSNMFDMR